MSSKDNAEQRKIMGCPLPSFKSIVQYKTFEMACILHSDNVRVGGSRSDRDDRNRHQACCMDACSWSKRMHTHRFFCMTGCTQQLTVGPPTSSNRQPLP